MYIKSKYFKIQELVPKEMYERYKDKCWDFLDPRLIESIDIIKERFNKGTIQINNWLWNGNRNWSGIRTPDSPYYSPSSMHSWGRAVDMIFSDYDPNEVRQDIIDNPEIYAHIKGLELDISWVHIDTRSRKDLLTFKA